MHTQRALSSLTPPHTHSPTSPITSQQLLLKMLFYLVVVYTVMTLASVPLWVLSGVELRAYAQGREIEAREWGMLSTGVYLTRGQARGRDEVQNGSKYLPFCLWLDTGLQCLLLVLLAIVQYRLFSLKQQHKGLHIEDYTLQFHPLPVLPPYILLPKLQHFLLTNLHKKYELVCPDIDVWDMTSACAEHTGMCWELRDELDGRRSLGQQGDRDRQIEEVLGVMEVGDMKEDTVWVTFCTREARYLAMRYFMTSQEQFLNTRLQVQKAPHPREILWQNLQVSRVRRLVYSLLSHLICLLALLLFDLGILCVYGSPHYIPASALIFLLEIVLQSLIVLVTARQKHRQQSQHDLSLLHKLYRYLYMNQALLIFVSSFHLGEGALLKVFTTGKYRRMDWQWHWDVGVSLLLGFGVQMVYVNVRPRIEVCKLRFRGWVGAFIARLKGLTGSKDGKQRDKPKSELNICYARLVAVVMFGNTYTLSHPVMYPLCALFCTLGYFSHRNYVLTLTQPAPYNHQHLNTCAIQYLYFSVIMHWVMVYLGHAFAPAIVAAIVLAGVLLCKNTLVRQLSKQIRKRFGPILFRKFEQVHSSPLGLGAILTDRQKCDTISQLYDKIRKYSLLYSKAHEREDYVSKGHLERHVKNLQERIDKLENSRHEQVNELSISQSMRRIRRNVEIKGQLSYRLGEQYFDRN